MNLDDCNQQDKAYAKILRMASCREQSSLRIQARLRAEGYSDEVIAEALQRAFDHRVIDDIRYADALVRMTLNSGKGLRSALTEIEELGIDPYDLPSYQDHEELGEEHEVERAVELLNRKPPRSKRPREAAYRKLIQQGFSSTVASKAARTWADFSIEHAENTLY